MRACKNCLSEFDGEFCSSCGQRHIEKQTLKFALHQLLDVLDFRRGLFKTTFYLLFKPNHMLSDYLGGKTKSYIHPVGYLLIVAGIFYLIDESGILGFTGIGMYGNQFQVLMSTIMIILFSSFIVGWLKFIRFNTIEVFLINLYGSAALLIFTFSLDIINHVTSIYWRGGDFLVLYSLIGLTFIVWFLRFYWLAFRAHIVGVLVNLLIISASMLLVVFLVDEVYAGEEEDDVRATYPATSYWVIQRKKIDIRTAYADSLVTNPLWIDLTNDKLDECVILFRDSISNPIIAIYKVDEEKPRMIHLQDYSLPREISAWKKSGNEVEIEFLDDVRATIFWDKTSFRVKSLLTKQEP